MRVNRLLRSQSVADFLRLPPDEQDGILQDYLWDNKVIQIGQGHCTRYSDPKIATGQMLRCLHCVRDSAYGKQLVKNATKVYYENAFLVPIHCLCEFMCDTVSDGMTPARRALLVTGVLMIEADIKNHITVPFADDNDVADAWTRDALEDLRQFGNAGRIIVGLDGEGEENGSDQATQNVLKDIAPVVGRLLRIFGKSRFEIKRTIHLAPGRVQSLDITSYWNVPTELARQQVSDGVATFKEVMQVRMEGWMRHETPSDGVVY
ncbi:hypothetical protein Purlil1_13877 [Purpureocillium lilacinum]|uniref:Uncharacterized protein n=1 Tax=Purpureocillium lilacinum TaxID=33203 RepID=A0ABR0BCW6_PURLI|nr:hypothetical protein Purlil1_13877 [Purpureocillium lilacinum]